MRTIVSLYFELLFAGTIMLVILYINNIFLYKQKLTDRVSMMLFFAVGMSLGEILWTGGEGKANLMPMTYIGMITYYVSFMLFASLLDRYLLERIGLRFKKIQIIILYVAPVVAFALFCLTTPLTRLVAWVDENGSVHGGVLAETFFYWLLMAYLFMPSFVALFFLTLGKRWRPAEGEISPSIFVFSVMVPFLYFMETALFDDLFSPYLTLSLPVSLALVYLMTNESTRTVLDTQAKVEAVEADLRIASKIQLDALPPLAPEFAEHLDLSLRGSMNTAKEVGGDFFDYFPLDENRICFLIADVSGKGTPAALFMMTAKTMIKVFAMTHDSTSEIFTAANALLCENNKEGMFATAWIGILDTRTMKLQYTNAGHNYPVLQRKGQPCDLILKNHGLFLAGLEFTQYKQSEIQLEPGDRLLLYTDGVVEAHDKNDGLYGEDRLKALMDESRDLPCEQVLKHILDDVNDFATGVPQFDDITMVILAIKE